LAGLPHHSRITLLKNATEFSIVFQIAFYVSLLQLTRWCPIKMSRIHHLT
jgi:hypothetical protein